MGLLNWLRGIFGIGNIPPHDYVDSRLLFQELDVEGMQKRMHLVESGKSRGAQNVPPVGQVSFDDIENRIVTDIQGKAGGAHDTVTSYLRAYNDRLAALKIGTRLAQLVTSADAARADFIASVERGRDQLFQLRRDVRDIREDFNRFRKQHGITRTPSYPLSQLWHWGVLLVLVLVETTLNGTLLARGHELGILGGVNQALIIAVINVALGTFAGRVAVPNLSHTRLWRKVAAVIGCVSLLCIALLFNLIVAHYRSVLGGENPSDAEKIAIQALLANPIAIREVSGWLLFVLGIGFSCIAAVDGWRMDDPYPGYGALARRVEERSQEYTEQKDQLLSQFEEIRDKAKSKMDALAGEVEVQADQNKNIQHSRLRCIQLFKNHLKYLEQCGNELLSAYRQANRMSRTSKPPAHFSQRWQLPVSPDEGIHNPPGAVNLEEKVRDTFESLGTARQHIDEAFQSALREFESLQELSGEATRGGSIHQG